MIRKHQEKVIFRVIFFSVNIDVKIQIKILAKEIQGHIITIVYLDKVGFIPELYG